jgi:hypothetical protein
MAGSLQKTHHAARPHRGAITARPSDDEEPVQVRIEPVETTNGAV